MIKAPGHRLVPVAGLIAPQGETQRRAYLTDSRGSQLRHSLAQSFLSHGYRIVEQPDSRAELRLEWQMTVSF